MTCVVEWVNVKGALAQGTIFEVDVKFAGDIFRLFSPIEGILVFAKHAPVQFKEARLHQVVLDRAKIHPLGHEIVKNIVLH